MAWRVFNIFKKKEKSSNGATMPTPQQAAKAALKKRKEFLKTFDARMKTHQKDATAANNLGLRDRYKTLADEAKKIETFIKPDGTKTFPQLARLLAEAEAQAGDRHTYKTALDNFQKEFQRIKDLRDNKTPAYIENATGWRKTFYTRMHNAGKATAAFLDRTPAMAKQAANWSWNGLKKLEAYTGNGLTTGLQKLREKSWVAKAETRLQKNKAGRITSSVVKEIGNRADLLAKALRTGQFRDYANILNPVAGHIDLKMQSVDKKIADQRMASVDDRKQNIRDRGGKAFSFSLGSKTLVFSMFGKSAATMYLDASELDSRRDELKRRRGYINELVITNKKNLAVIEITDLSLNDDTVLKIADTKALINFKRTQDGGSRIKTIKANRTGPVTFDHIDTDDVLLQHPGTVSFNNMPHAVNFYSEEGESLIVTHSDIDNLYMPKLSKFRAEGRTRWEADDNNVRSIYKNSCNLIAAPNQIVKKGKLVFSEAIPHGSSSTVLCGNLNDFSVFTADEHFGLTRANTLVAQRVGHQFVELKQEIVNDGLTQHTRIVKTKVSQAQINAYKVAVEEFKKNIEESGADTTLISIQPAMEKHFGLEFDDSNVFGSKLRTFLENVRAEDPYKYDTALDKSLHLTHDDGTPVASRKGSFIKRKSQRQHMHNMANT